MEEGQRDLFEDDERPPPNLAVRRLPVPVEAPALTRSVLFRPKAIRDPIAARYEGEYKKRRQTRAEDLNRFLENVSRNDAFQGFTARFKVDDDVETRTGNERNSQETFYQRISNDASLFNIDLIVEIYAETFAITFQVHRKERSYFAEAASLKSVSSAPNIEERVAAALRLLIDDPAAGANQTAHPLANASFVQIDKMQDTLYGEFWADLDNKLQLAWESIEYKNDKSKNYQQLAEFRGVCLTTMSLPELKERAERRSSPQDKYGLPQITSTSIRHPDPGKIAPEVTNFINNRRGYFARLLGYSSSIADVSRPPEGGNTVMCGMLDGLAAYAAAFQSEKSNPEAPPNYVRYTVVFAGVSSNQLGRLVLRLHRSGISRVCALIDARQIDKCSNALRRIGLAMGGSHAHPDTPVPSMNRRKAVTDASTALRNTLSSCRGGLRFRIAQSRYYASRLSHTIKDLRIVRIGGWQTYDDFLKRHLFGQLEKIDRLGHRLDDLTRRIDHEQSALLSEDLIALTKSTAEHTKATRDANDKVVEATEQISRANKELIELQFTAEVFAFVAAGYYFPSVLTATFNLTDGNKQLAYGLTAVVLILAFFIHNRHDLGEAWGKLMNSLRKSMAGFGKAKGHTQDPPAA